MNRREFVEVVTVAITGGLGGCTGGIGSTPTSSPAAGTDRTESSSPNSPTTEADGTDASECPGDTATAGGPQSSSDTLTLHRMPDYVTEYEATVIVRYEALGAAATRAVDGALDGERYRQCITDREQTDVMALFAHVERRWEETGRESFEHTYLQYEDSYYGISLVQEGDFVRTDSIPCTAEACPTTPTPPG